MASKNAARSGSLGAFAQAKNHQVASGYPNYPLFEDATGTPVLSPVALTTAYTLINVPAAAVGITINGAVAVRVADSSNAAGGYFVCPANVPVEIPITTPTSDPNDTTGQLWLAADSTSGNCSFFFSCV